LREQQGGTEGLIKTVGFKKCPLKKKVENSASIQFTHCSIDMFVPRLVKIGESEVTRMMHGKVGLYMTLVISPACLHH